VSDTATTLVIPRLSRIDRLELLEEFKPGEIRFEDEQPANGTFGEPITLAVVVCTLATINALTAYLLKDKDHGTVRREVRERRPDGTERVETIEVDIDKSRAPKADVLKQLAALTHIDISSLLDTSAPK